VADLVSFLAALSDPTRLRILQLLRRGAMDVSTLQKCLQSPQPTVSRHLAYLRRAGVVATLRDGKRIVYRIEVAPLLQVIMDATLSAITVPAREVRGGVEGNIESRSARNSRGASAQPAPRRKKARRNDHAVVESMAPRTILEPLDDLSRID
jgi:DNA-binding transcriptional ArsR family regulator